MDLPDPRRPRASRSFPPHYLALRAEFAQAVVALWAVAGILLVVVAMLILR